MIDIQDSPSELAQSGLYPQPEMLEIGKKRQRLVIGLPKECQKHERRIALTPQAVKMLVYNGHIVKIERQAGQGANFDDQDFADVGATIIEHKEEIYNADIILKIDLLSVKEINMLRGNQLLITAFNLPSQSREQLQKLMQKKITAIAFEYIQNEEGYFPVVQGMNEISGSTAIMIAAEYLSSFQGGKGILLGGFSGIPPTEVIILGATTASEYAARTALGLGAFVKIFDTSVEKLRRMERNIGQHLYTSLYHAQELSHALKTADVVIGAVDVMSAERYPRLYVTEDMIKTMKRHSVIIDLSIDQGGCFETSRQTDHSKPVFKKHGVIHYCVPNIAARFARTASMALSDYFAPFLFELSEAGSIEQYLRTFPYGRHGVYIYKGILTNSFIGRNYGLLSHNIDLLIPTFKQ